MVLVLIWIEYGKEPGQQIVKVVLSIGISAAKTDPDSPLVIDRLWDLKNMTIHIRIIREVVLKYPYSICSRIST